MVLSNIIGNLVGYFSDEPLIHFAKTLPDAIEPTRRDDTSIGYDLYTPIPFYLEPGERIIIDTGIIFECPSHLGIFIWDKSSVAFKNKLSVCAGVIDSGYRGSIGVLLENCASKKIYVEKGSAIAQAVFQHVMRPKLKIVKQEELTTTVRGKRAFGEEALPVY